MKIVSFSSKGQKVKMYKNFKDLKKNVEICKWHNLAEKFILIEAEVKL